MKMNLIFSFIGILVFTCFLFLAIKYVNGNWQFKEKNKAAYIYWVEKNGNKMKKQIIIVAIVYYILMAFQILIYL